ncbi:MAG TPA: HAMP domain-containing sensor histidine kinase [Noviherbaspirillum sp.]|jgi:signal transduction histidine kinase|uniref:sensor histidine kinase n=1 Tax=Noviherbaspirillum sp. TaxID=1926288 RepID=UPI002F9589E3
MTLSTDQDKTPGQLSQTAQRMLALRETVIARWDDRVRAEVKQARQLSRPILADSLPLFYDDLVQAVSVCHLRNSAAVPTASVGAEHGNERARLTDYDVGAVITEYQLLRSTLLETLKQRDVPLSEEEHSVITAVFDATIKESVTAFALAESVFRERFVAALVHDLRTPLGAISLLAELIAANKDVDKVHAIAGQVQSNVKRMDGMLHDLLDAVVFHSGARQQLRPTYFDALDLAEEVRSQNIAFGHRIRIEGRSVGGWWDREKLKRALENLVENAVKYGASDTPISIRTDTYSERLVLSVHNAGCGIPTEQLESVFQVFQRAKLAKEGEAKGWGIGLPFVRSVAESHGGSIGVDSADERGTTFAIDIPLDARRFQNAPVLEEGKAGPEGAEGSPGKSG